MRMLGLAGAIAMALNGVGHAADLSPGRWPQAERGRIEALEHRSWSPLDARTVSGNGGMISATVSPIAVRAGIEALRQGGTAADAAATVALTQVTTQLGSVVSFAGIFSMVYYEAGTGKVHSMDAGFNSYLGETDPKTIPVSDMGGVSFAPKPTESATGKGRATLVPGFMAGVEAMHERFGKLRFGELFVPSIWYAEHGVRISPNLAGFFQLRQKHFARTVEGRGFMAQAGGEIPKLGDMFVQADLARTLKGVAANGSRQMYTGQWAKDFVALIQREGGKATAEDLARYAPIWSEPYKETVFGHTVYTNGAPHYGAYNILPGLNLAEVLELDAKGPYWSDGATFAALTRIGEVTLAAPQITGNAKVADFLLAKGVDISPEAQLGKTYARQVAPLLDSLFTPAASDEPRHSNSIVVVDREGNIAAITHTINTVVWGDSGIVVGGIPIPDAAGFQQERLAMLAPGGRVPHEIIDVIAFAGERPVLATAGIGASIVPETLRTLVSVLGQRQDLAAVMRAPAMLSNFDRPRVDQPPSQRSFAVPQGAYSSEFAAAAKERGLNLAEMPAAAVVALRGTLAAVTIDQATGRRAAADQPGVITFNDAE